MYAGAAILLMTFHLNVINVHIAAAMIGLSLVKSVGSVNPLNIIASAQAISG